jgi:hypothetical protein
VLCLNTVVLLAAKFGSSSCSTKIRMSPCFVKAFVNNLASNSNQNLSKSSNIIGGNVGSLDAQ